MKPQVFTGPVATSSIRPCDLHSCTKADILEYFENAYSLDEWLFSSLQDEDAFYKTPDRLRLPLIFYYAHPAVVFVNKLLLAGLIKKRVNETFESLFETGVDEMSWDDTENYRMGGAYKWPAVEDVRQYRRKVRELVREVIRNTELCLPINKESKWWAVFMGIEHERIHIETSSVLIRQLPIEMVEKPNGWKYGPLNAGQQVLKNPMLIAGDVDVVIGKDFDGNLWGWDNEYGRREMRVPKFKASKFLVTNREFFEFIQSGGYQDRKFWSVEGWRWKTFRKAKHPTFWVCSENCKSGCGSNLAGYSHCQKQRNDDKYYFRLMFDIVQLPLDWPVEVNYLEAKAFCKWKGNQLRLPTEAEQQVMRSLPPFDPALETISNRADPKHNIDLTYGSSTPVGMYPPSPSGFCDVFGNVWEWTEDHFNGLPGGGTHYLYDDFSAPCYDGKHTMITGGSWISTGGEASRYARFSFRRHFFQHMGFRVAKTLEPTNYSPVIYVDTPMYISDHGVEESEIDVAEAAELRLDPILSESTSIAIRNDTEENLAKLVQRQFSNRPGPLLGQKYMEHLSQRSCARALVIGCGPGRIAFELTTIFSEVIGCDVSGRCVDFAKKLAEDQHIIPPLVGANSETFLQNTHIQLPEGTDPSKVVFKHLTWIPVELGKFDLVVIDGLVRLPNKKAWLAVLPNIIKNVGSTILVLDQDEETKSMLNTILKMIASKQDNKKYDDYITEIVLRSHSDGAKTTV